jgi:hypothetical protein
VYPTYPTRDGDRGGRDPFAKILNQADIQQLLAAAGNPSD